MEWLFDSPGLYLFLASLFGLIVGSFLNVVIYRYPKMMEYQWRVECHECFPDEIAAPEKRERFNLSLPASHCPSCLEPVKAYDNIPVVSWLLLRGKCRNCETTISARYPMIELLTAFMAGSVAYVLSGYWSLAVIGATFVLIALCFIDLDTMLLPDQMTLPLMWAGILLALVGISPLTLEQSVIGAMVGYLSLWSVFQVFKVITGKEGMGYGDFKLLAALGAWLGWQPIPLLVLLASFAGALGGIIMMRVNNSGKDTPFSFGPYLAMAGWICLLWGNKIIDWYLTSYLGF